MVSVDFGDPFPWLDLPVAELAGIVARREGVSEVAAGPRGFLEAYRRSGGEPDVLGYYSPTQSWRDRRNNFLKRHVAQVKAAGEPLWTPQGRPTRRHLALAVWAYSPHPEQIQHWLSKQVRK